MRTLLISAFSILSVCTVYQHAAIQRRQRSMVQFLVTNKSTTKIKYGYRYFSRKSDSTKSTGYRLRFYKQHSG